MQGVVAFPKPLRTAKADRGIRIASWRSILALMLREISTTYGRSPGGYLWAVLEPVAAITLLSAIFAIGFRAPPLGRDFALFYATGMLPFLAFHHVCNTVTTAIVFSKALLAYPSVTFIDAILARFCLNLLTQLIVFLMVITGLLVLLPAQMPLDVMKVIQALSLMACLSLGIGTLNCFLASMFPLWQRIWSVITRPLFLVSGIIFILEIVPHPYQDYLLFNPLIHIVSLMRSGFYVGYDADWVSSIFVISVSGVSFFFGLLFLKRYHRDIVHS